MKRSEEHPKAKRHKAPKIRDLRIDKSSVTILESRALFKETYPNKNSDEIDPIQAIEEKNITRPNVKVIVPPKKATFKTKKKRYEFPKLEDLQAIQSDTEKSKTCFKALAEVKSARNLAKLSVIQGKKYGTIHIPKKISPKKVVSFSQMKLRSLKSAKLRGSASKEGLKNIEASTKFKECFRYKLLHIDAKEPSAAGNEKYLEAASANIQQKWQFKATKPIDLRVDESNEIPEAGLSFMKEQTKKEKFSDVTNSKRAKDFEFHKDFTAITKADSTFQDETIKESAAEASVKRIILKDKRTETAMAKKADKKSQMLSITSSLKTSSTQYNIVDEVYSRFRDREKSTQTETIYDEILIEQDNTFKKEKQLTNVHSANIQTHFTDSGKERNIMRFGFETSRQQKFEFAHDTKKNPSDSIELKNQDFEINEVDAQLDLAIIRTLEKREFEPNFKNNNILVKDYIIKTETEYQQAGTITAALVAKDENIENEVFQDTFNQTSDNEEEEENSSEQESIDAAVLQKELFEFDEVEHLYRPDWKYDSNYTRSQVIDKNFDKQSIDSDRETEKQDRRAITSILKVVRNTIYNFVATDKYVYTKEECGGTVVKVLDSPNRITMTVVEQRDDKKPAAQLQEYQNDEWKFVTNDTETQNFNKNYVNASFSPHVSGNEDNQGTDQREADVQVDREVEQGIDQEVGQEVSQEVDEELKQEPDQKAGISGLSSVFKFVRSSFYNYMAANVEVKPLKKEESFLIKTMDSSNRKSPSTMRHHHHQKQSNEYLTCIL